VFVVDWRMGNVLVERGLVEPHAVWSGEYWRLASYMVFHGGWIHLLMNCAMSIGLMSGIEAALGKRRFLIAYVLSGLAGGMASTVVSYAPSVGASGAIFGIVGAMLALRWRQLGSVKAITADKPTRSILLQIAVWTVIGMQLHFNNRAHFGGMITGAVVAWIMTAPRLRREMWVAFTIAFLALTVFATKPWMRGEKQPARDVWAIEDPLLAKCQAGMTAACYAFELSMPENVGDTTRELEPKCTAGDQDACGAWGWALAHGRPGVPRDEARGATVMKDACAKGSAWSCGLAKGAAPTEL